MERKNLNAKSAETMAEAYQKCLDRERAREWKWRHTRQGAFESSMVRFEQCLDDAEAQDKSRIFARTATLGGVIADPDREDTVEISKRKLDNACHHLSDVGKEHLVPVLRLIAKNRNNEDESVWELMKENGKSPAKNIGGTARNCANTGASIRTKKIRKITTRSGAVKKK